MKFDFYIFLMLLIIVTTLTGYSMNNEKLRNYNNDSQFKIIFWGDSVKDIVELQGLTYDQCISKFVPLQIISDTYILKYYWDEQLIEFEYERMKDDTGRDFIWTGGFFTLILNNKIIFHGLNKTVIPARKFKYDDSDYPAIIAKACTNQKNLILALKPRFYPDLDIFRDYDEKEQKKILNQGVLKHFEEQGKIIRGKIDLEKIFKHNHVSFNNGIPVRDLMK